METLDKLKRSQATYRDLRNKWLKTLTGDHPNAVWLQLDRLVTDEAWFKFVVRLRKRANDPPVNDHLWDIFITGYGVKQSLGVCRLTDPDQKTASLLGLVHHMVANKSLFTREVMVGYNGTSMDVEALLQEVSMTKDPNKERLAVQRWSDADHAHKAFDRLRDAPLGSSRFPGDKISDCVSDALKEALTSDAIRRIRHRRDKYLAHADLSDLSDGLASPTYNDIHESIRTLVHVDQFLRADFFNHSGSSVLSTYQGDALRNLSKPLVPPMSDDIYEQEWNDVAANMEHWGTVEEFRRFAVHSILHEPNGD